MAESTLKTIGKYQILDHIGESAAGITYRARDAFRNSELAVKVIRDISPLTPELKNRLYTALAGYSELSHRHIRKIHDLGEVEGQVYIASEMLTGLDLTGFLEGEMPIAQKLSLMAQVCEALAFAHGKGLAHGNLKPGNIFVADARDAMLLDFGIGTWQECMLAAKARPEGLLPNYLAPEQILGEPFDARSDLFSLGLILYQVVTGKYPFQVPAGLVPRELVHSEPELLRKVDPQMPEELEQLLVSALNKDPQQRLQTADEFAASLYKIAGRLRREQTVPTMMEAPPPPFMAPALPEAPERERFSAAESIRTESRSAENSRTEKPAADRQVPVLHDTALQPWSTRPSSPPPPPPPPQPNPAREEPVRQQPALSQHSDMTVMLPAPILPPPVQAAPAQPLAAQPPAAQAPAAQPVARATTPQAPASPARPASAPRQNQRAAPSKTPYKLTSRILILVASAVIAVWLVGMFVSRQSLHATQSKEHVQIAPVPKPAHEASQQPVPEPPAAPAPEPPKPVEIVKKGPSAEQILRLRVKPLWEAGKYAQAMQEVNQALAADPSSADAHTWKKKIQSAQDAENAIK